MPRSSLSRRRFLQATGLATLGLPAARLAAASSASPLSLVKPPRLRPGDKVGLISPGGLISNAISVGAAEEDLAGLGLRTKRGRHVLDKRGYLGGTDQERASDVNTMFADPEVKGIVTMRGGWGCSRILPLLDYDLIRANPKILVGFSDITSLLIAIYVKSGVVTFHGPVGISSWNDFTVDYFLRTLFDGERVRMENPEQEHLLFAAGSRGDRERSVRTITPGKARGRLVGGNLSVLTSIIGSGYLPDWSGHILFLEDVGEQTYRIDRMLTQLKLAGILDQLAGLVFGQCSDCDPGRGQDELTLEEVFRDHIAPLGIPAFHGSAIGHISDKFTVPLGIETEVDATAGTITLLESAVV